MRRVASAMAVMAYVAAGSACADASLEGADGIRISNQKVSVRHSLGMDGLVFGYAGRPGGDEPDVHAVTLRRHAGIELPAIGRDRDRLIQDHDDFGGLTVGYAWRGLSVERASFARLERNRPPLAENEPFKLDAKSTRLSYTPSPNWSFRLSRGSISGLDQFEPHEEIRRTTLAATYRHTFSDANWQTTLAWGRNARKMRGSTVGYLLESTLRFSDAHAIFGRVEEIGGDDLAQVNKAAQHLSVKLDRLTFGYLYGIRTRGPLKLDVGMLANRYLPSNLSSNHYRVEPTSYVLIVRLNLQ